MRSSSALSFKANRDTSVLTNPNRVEFEYASLDEAFPKIDPGLRPFGSCVLLQVKQPKTVTKGGIILSDADRSTEHYNTQVGKVIALGELCFKSILAGPRRADGSETEYAAEWPGGSWFKEGDYVRVPKFGGDRFAVRGKRTVMEVNPETGRKEPNTINDEVIFALFKAKDILGVITGDPLAVTSYLD